MDMTELIERLTELAEYVEPREWDLPLDLADVLREAAEKLKKMRWIPVEERVPNGNRMTLVLTANGAVVAARFISRLQSWTGPGRYATHWMPLPEPPEMSEHE